MLGRLVLALTCSVGAAASALADSEYDRARARAREVQSRPGADLATVANDESGPDPWLVVDALLEAKAPDAAKAFAASSRRAGASALVAYASRPPREPSWARSTLAEAEGRLTAPAEDAAAAEAAATEALKLLGGSIELAPSVLRIRWLEARARALDRLGRMREAAKDYRAGSETAEKLAWIQRAALLSNKCGFESRKDSDLRSALAAFERAAALSRSLDWKSEEIHSLLCVAELHVRFGDAGAADDCLVRAATISDGVSDAALRAEISARRGTVHAITGRFELGRRELTEAIEALTPSGPSLVLGDAWSDLGHVRLELGDRRGAREAFVQAHAAFDATSEQSDWDPNARAAGLAAAASNAAILLADELRFDEAYAAFRAQREAFLAQQDPAMAARALQSMSEVRLRQIARAGPGADRAKWLAQALADARNAESESEAVQDPAGRLGARGNRGVAEEALGHAEDAIRLYEDVVREAEERGLSSLVLEFAVRLARARWSAEDSAGTIRAVEVGVTCLDRTFEEFGDQTRIEARSRHAELFELGMRAALARQDRTGLEKLFRYAEMGRATSLLDALENREALRGRGVRPELEKARVEAARVVVQARLALEATGGGRDAAALKAQAAFADAKGAYERAVDAIQTDARVSANLLYPQPITLTDAQAGLRADEALVVYLHVDAKACAIVVTRQDARLVELGGDESVTEACQVALVRGSSASAAEGWRSAAEKAWHPIERLLPGTITRVCVSPDGDLGLLPFPALPPAAKDSKAPVVAASRSCTFVPSATTMFVLRETAGRGGHGVLALGISKYQSLPVLAGTPIRARSGFGELPAAEEEATALSDPEAGDVRLLGPRATEDNFFDALRGHAPWSALHFAVHGQLDRLNPTLSYLVLAPSARNDGDLTVFELLQHDMAADVAVLAACDSGGGAPVPGEGLVGLVRSFIFAGCPRVVASLWNAEDAAARQFSLAFHARWRTGTATFEECLEAGRAEVRKNARWQHPFYWAGWCGWGASKVVVESPAPPGK